MNSTDWFPLIAVGSFLVCLGRVAVAGRALGRCLRGRDVPVEYHQYTAPGPRCNTAGGMCFLFSAAARAWAKRDPAFARARRDVFRALLWLFPGWPVLGLLALLFLAWLGRGSG